MKDLTVIIISYNTKDVTKKCISHVLNALEASPKLRSEIILVDNNSTDGSVEMLRRIERRRGDEGAEGEEEEGEERRRGEEDIEIKTIFNSENMGFARANNEGVATSTGKYILFLNSDVFINDVDFEDLLYYMDKNPKVGVLTVKVVLPNGSIDKASHRGFPTIWNSFTYFAKLEKLFAKVPALSKFFGEYHLTHLDINTIHEIDSPTGAFYLTQAKILKELNGFDTDYFMYGEDLDLSFRIKKLGYKVIYYPLFTATHLKHRSGFQTKTMSVQKKTGEYFYDAMGVFYDKHFAPHNSFIENALTHFFINLKSKLPR